MKIGLLTHHWPANFGANLQAFSTVKTLENLGHEVIILNYRPAEMVSRYDSVVSREQTKQHEEFINRYMHQSSLCVSETNVKEIASEANIETVICGSDAVLRLDPSSSREDLSFPNPFWLNWADNNIRKGFLAASSMGSQYFQQSKHARSGIKKAVLDLDFCSVRDKWTKSMLRICGVPKSAIHHCPDPVSGLKRAIVNEDIDMLDTGDDPYILVSMYDNMVSANWISDLCHKAHNVGYKVYALPQPDVNPQGLYDKILELPMSPFDWYQWIANSAGYVGVRFHPIMLAQINNVPYVAFDDYDVGLKFTGKFLSKVARKLRSQTRFVSKTYDACKRVNSQQYCIPPRDFKKTSPQQVLDLLDVARKTNDFTDFIDKNEQQFLYVLKSIIGDEH